MAIQRARDANMPLDTIDRAIKRAAGAGEAANFQEITYEGYGPNGVAVLVEALTDHRNRAAEEIRSVFSRNGGNLGESGSVRWLFEARGRITVQPDGRDPDEIALEVIDAGADDVQVDEDVLEVYTDPGHLEALRRTLEGNGLNVVSSETDMVPSTTVALEERVAEQTFRLIERLEELDDVQNVYSNSEIPDEVAAALAG
jgi:YebC/PmpR family DNA-binding regulatory protein